VCGECGTAHRTWYDRKTRRVRDLSCGDTRVVLEVEVRRVQCTKRGGVKSERLDWMVHRRL
jgi:transposase